MRTPIARHLRFALYNNKKSQCVQLIYVYARCRSFSVFGVFGRRPRRRRRCRSISVIVSGEFYKVRMLSKDLYLK